MDSYQKEVDNKVRSALENSASEITEPNERLFNFKAVVLVLNHDGKSWEVANPLPVKSDGKLIGFASLLLAENNRLIADVNISYSTPERLDIETKQRKLYLHPYSKPTATNFIDHLVLNEVPHVDSRISPVGELFL